MLSQRVWCNVVFKYYCNRTLEEEDSIEPYMDLSISEESSDESEQEEEEESDEDLNNWGKKKKLYYKDDEESDEEDDSEGLDVDEEKEVLQIQKKKASKRRTEDYEDTFDYFSKERNKQSSTSTERSLLHSLRSRFSEGRGTQETKLSQLDKLSKSQKILTLQKDCPEILEIIEEYENHLEELKHILPFMSKINSTPQSNSSLYIQLRYQTLVNLCINLSYYLSLKAGDMNVGELHPVNENITRARNLLQEMDPLHSLFNIFLGQTNEQQTAKPIKPRKSVKFAAQLEEYEDDSMSEDSDSSADKFYKEIEEKVTQKKRKRAEEKHELENYFEYRPQREANGKRKVTREIEKNIGLRRKRKKIDRNARVKNKVKYLKALKRRKGQVISMRDESKPYTGEATGINKYNVRVTKLK